MIAVKKPNIKKFLFLENESKGEEENKQQQQPQLSISAAQQEEIKVMVLKFFKQDFVDNVLNQTEYWNKNNLEVSEVKYEKDDDTSFAVSFKFNQIENSFEAASEELQNTFDIANNLDELNVINKLLEFIYIVRISEKPIEISLLPKLIKATETNKKVFKPENLDIKEINSLVKISLYQGTKKIFSNDFYTSKKITKESMFLHVENYLFLPTKNISYQILEPIRENTEFVSLYGLKEITKNPDNEELVDFVNFHYILPPNISAGQYVEPGSNPNLFIKQIFSQQESFIDKFSFTYFEWLKNNLSDMWFQQVAKIIKEGIAESLDLSPDIFSTYKVNKNDTSGQFSLFVSFNYSDIIKSVLDLYARNYESLPAGTKRRLQNAESKASMYDNQENQIDFKFIFSRFDVSLAIDKDHLSIFSTAFQQFPWPNSENFTELLVSNSKFSNPITPEYILSVVEQDVAINLS